MKLTVVLSYEIFVVLFLEWKTHKNILYYQCIVHETAITNLSCSDSCNEIDAEHLLRDAPFTIETSLTTKYLISPPSQSSCSRQINIGLALPNKPLPLCMADLHNLFSFHPLSVKRCESLFVNLFFLASSADLRARFALPSANTLEHVYCCYCCYQWNKLTFSPFLFRHTRKKTVSNSHIVNCSTRKVWSGSRGRSIFSRHLYPEQDEDGISAGLGVSRGDGKFGQNNSLLEHNSSKVMWG